MVIESMAAQGKEPTFCMGDDIPLAVLSQKPHMLYDYFKQRFAQVGNVVICSLGYSHEVSAVSLDMSSFCFQHLLCSFIGCQACFFLFL